MKSCIPDSSLFSKDRGRFRQCGSGCLDARSPVYSALGITSHSAWQQALENDGESDAGDRVASEEEVRAALAELEHDDVATARLAAAAEAILRRHPRLAHVGPQDLIQEALFRRLIAA